MTIEGFGFIWLNNIFKKVALFIIITVVYEKFCKYV